MASAVSGGLLAAASVALYHVHDWASLTAVFRHAIRDWYELPVFLGVASLLFYAVGRRGDSAHIDDTVASTADDS